MRILITGGTGFVGRALSLRLANHDLTVLSRDVERARHMLGADINVRPLDDDGLTELVQECDAIINLAGSPSADQRWNESNRQRIRRSRVETTSRLVDAMRRASKRPATLISASATGYYGAHRPSEQLREDSPSGADFLADVCRDWEAAANRATDLGVRVVTLRTGIVLGPHGGALGKVARLFRWRVGGRLGDGQQVMAWIHLDDILNGIATALTDERYEGAVNLCSPNPVYNREFTAAVAAALGSRPFLPTPRWALKAALGERAVMLLGSAEVQPARLEQLGYQFRFPTLEGTLADLFGSTGITISSTESAPSSDYLEERGARYVLKADTTLKAEMEEVFDFFSKAENLGAITPPGLGFKITDKPDSISEGALIDYRVRLGPAPMSWRTRIEVWEPMKRFVDAQLRGPYKSWWHEHSFTTTDQSVTMTDRVYYSPPLGVLGRLAHGLFIRQKLEEIFGYRRFAVRWRFGAQTRPNLAPLSARSNYQP